MFKSTKLGIKLTFQCLKIYRKNIFWLVFPFLGKGSYLLVASLFALWLNFLSHHGINIATLPKSTITKAYLIIILALFCCNLFNSFTSAALALCIGEYVAGLKITFKETLIITLKKWRYLLNWILISISLGILLRFFRNYFRNKKRINELVNNLPWHRATYLLIPALLYHSDNIFDALQESSFLVRNYTANKKFFKFSLVLPLTLLRMLAFIPISLALNVKYIHIAAIISLFTVTLLIIISIINLCFRQMMKSIIYHYLKKKILPNELNEKDFLQAL